VVVHHLVPFPWVVDLAEAEWNLVEPRCVLPSLYWNKK
jgi:hypothetical protein